MKSKHFTRVGDMYLKAGFAHVDGGPPALIDEAEADFRIKLLTEETSELAVAHSEGDLVGVADAIGDLIVVALGTAHCYRIPIDPVIDAIMDANDKKEVGVTDRGHKNDLIKPEGWVGPEERIREILTNHLMENPSE